MDSQQIAFAIGFFLLLVLDALMLYFSVPYQSSLLDLRSTVYDINTTNCPDSLCISRAQLYDSEVTMAYRLTFVYQVLAGISALFALVVIVDVFKRRNMISSGAIPYFAAISVITFLVNGIIAVSSCGRTWNLELQYRSPMPDFVLDALHETLVRGITVVTLACWVWGLAALALVCILILVACMYCCTSEEPTSAAPAVPQAPIECPALTSV
jgi:hypothetical protein